MGRVLLIFFGGGGGFFGHPNQYNSSTSFLDTAMAQNSRVCVRKETVSIDILLPSRNGDRKIMQSIRLMKKPPSRIRKGNKLNQFKWASTKVIPIEKTRAGYILMMSQGLTEAASGGPTVLHIQFCSFEHFQVASRSTRQDMTPLFYARQYGRFIQIQSNLRRKKLHRPDQDSNLLFFLASTIEIM